MNEPFKLARLNQCDKCPWKVSTDPNDIPHGYSCDKHQNLAGTIAEQGNNTMLRFKMRNCTNADRIRLDGPQHPHFTDTLPR